MKLKKTSLAIHAILSKLSPNHYTFGGVVKSPSGEFIAHVRGIVPACMLQLKNTPARRPGRPKDISGAIALLANFHMLREEISRIKGISARRCAAATKVNLGDRELPDNQSRQAAAKLKKAEAELSRRNVTTITYCGEDNELLWFAIEDGDNHIHTLPDKWIVDGMGWDCKFGMHDATYGYIKCIIPRWEH